jgi:tripartite-type tricarboxylate transporter receptor subunit TctC
MPVLVSASAYVEFCPRAALSAVTATSRLVAAPEIPTVDEAGLPGFYFSNWFALFGPKGLPKDVTAKLLPW